MRVVPIFERPFLSGRVAASGGRRLRNSALLSCHRGKCRRDRSGASQPISNFSPHERLGVSEDANLKEIKRAFRKMAMKHHPDREGGSEANFLLVIEAYEILTGKRDGKEAPEKGNSWEFHDWFWKFTINRRRGGASAASKDQAFASRSQMQTQLAGLRHRAAIRSIKRKQSQQPQATDSDDHQAFHTETSTPFDHQSDSEGSVSSEFVENGGEGLEHRAEDYQDSAESPADSGCVGESEHEAEARLRRITEEARRRAALDGSDAKQAVRGQLSGLKRKAKLRETVTQEPDWAYPCGS